MQNEFLPHTVQSEGGGKGAGGGGVETLHYLQVQVTDTQLLRYCHAGET